MKRETIAIHAGYEPDAAVRSVAVPIYQTVAYAFDSAEHAAALFNLEAEGYRYTRISQSHHGRAGAARGRARRRSGGAVRGHRPGRACTTRCSTSPAGQQHRLAAAALRHDAHAVRTRAAGPGRHRAVRRVRPSRGDRAAHRRRDPRRLLRERRQSRRQHLRHRGAGRGRAPARRAADGGQHRGDADAAAADRLRRRHRRAFADQVHGRAWHDARRRHRRQRQVSVGRARRALSRCSASPTTRITAWSTPTITAPAAYIARCRSVYQRTTGAVLSPLSAFLLLQGIETVALRVERHVENGRKVAEFLRDDPRVDWVNYAGFADTPTTRWRRNISAAGLLAHDVRRHGRIRGRQAVLRRAQADQAAGQPGRRQVAGLPSGVDHPPADVARANSARPA